jgi:hypothetical protein
MGRNTPCPQGFHAHVARSVRILSAARAWQTALSPAMPDRRFPPPWTIEERQACFIVKDGNGQALAYVYFEEEPGRRAAENLMSHDEAGALAVNIAKLPELLGR